jgi:contact-dependent growth inhibition (CDI) system CdiI-like immunity protein
VLCTEGVGHNTFGLVQGPGPGARNMLRWRLLTVAYALAMGSYPEKPYEQSPLMLFLDAYFHEDWAIDADNWQSVVQDFLRSADDSAVIELIADIDEVLAERIDPAVARLLAVHLVNVDLRRAEFATAWDWLQLVQHLLIAHLHRGTSKIIPTTFGVACAEQWMDDWEPTVVWRGGMTIETAGDAARDFVAADALNRWALVVEVVQSSDRVLVVERHCLQHMNRGEQAGVYMRVSPETHRLLRMAAEQEGA